MKLRTAIVFGIGYLLGARAGRDRYEQLRRTYRRAASNENVRKVIDQGKEIVDSGTAQVRDKAADQLKNAGDVIRDRTERSS
ncbi:MAG: YtxH domain-containing protein [Acidimicrobiia bacterium]|nr:YtxH domain-containing protein [Acidimicrobiia bacterium]